MSRKTILSVIALAIAAVIALSLCSCQSEYDDPKYSDPDYFYTREYIESVKDGSRFATSRSGGDLEAILAFIYSDDSIRENHGSTFNLTINDLIGSSEGRTILGFWEAKGDYHFCLDDQWYFISAVKGFFDSKWHVDVFEETEKPGWL